MRVSARASARGYWQTKGAISRALAVCATYLVPGCDSPAGERKCGTDDARRNTIISVCAPFASGCGGPRLTDLQTQRRTAELQQQSSAELIALCVEQMQRHVREQQLQIQERVRESPALANFHQSACFRANARDGDNERCKAFLAQPIEYGPNCSRRGRRRTSVPAIYHAVRCGALPNRLGTRTSWPHAPHAAHAPAGATHTRRARPARRSDPRRCRPRSPSTRPTTLGSS